MDDTTIWILVIAALVVAALVAFTLARRAAHRRRLRERFGPEYDRAAERRGSRRGADAELDERLDRHDRLDLRPLGPESREAYAARWDEVQSRFVDAPEVAVRHAQVLLDAVMAERGYPIGDELTARVDLVSVDHPELADHYRVAHRLHVESVGAGDGATEAQRQALLHYRALFAELLDAGRGGDGVGDELVDPVVEDGVAEDRTAVGDDRPRHMIPRRP